MIENNNHNKNNKSFINPFSPQYPAVPKYFANRREQLDYFSKTIVSSAKIRPPAPNNFIVLGDWGMGKTSLLYKMREVALKELKDEIRAFCCYFWLDPLCCKDWDNFCLRFLTQLKKNYEASAGLREKLVRELSKWKIAVSVPPVSVEKEKKEEKPSLVDSLEELWKKHLQPSEVDICLLFLDDVHYFLQAGQSDAYFAIRNAFQELANRSCNFSLVVTGPTMLSKAIVDLAEPFMRFFHQFTLEPFPLEGTKEALNKRIHANKLELEFSDEAISTIHEKSRGHPYFVMFIAYELVNLLGSKKMISQREIDKHWPQAVSVLERNVFVNRLGEVSEKEKQVLVRIASIKEKQVSPSMIKEVKGATEFLSRLERKGLLLKKERGQYELFHPLFKEYLKKITSN
jgi:hypothetical protein